MSNITSIKTKNNSPHQILFGNKPELPTSLRIFVEMGLVTTKNDIQGKLKNRGLTYIFVRYSVDHANYVFRKLNLNSKRIIQIRDVWKILQ
jgi:hypothetical protein